MNDLKFSPSPDVLSQVLGEKTVLVHLQSNQIYELNATASRIWSLLAEDMSLLALRKQLALEYRADSSQLEQEVDALLEMLKTEGLIRVCEQS